MFNNLINKEIILIKKDGELKANLNSILNKNSCKTYTFLNCSEVDDRLVCKADLIILNADYYQNNVLEFLKILRKNENNIDVIITSHKKDPDMLLASVDYGVKKYFIKPISVLEILNFMEKLFEPKNKIIRFNDESQYNYGKKAYISKDKIIYFTPQESKIIELLYENRERIVTFEEIQNTMSKNNKNISIWNIRTTIKNIRNKIDKSVIINVARAGYRFGNK